MWLDSKDRKALQRRLEDQVRVRPPSTHHASGKTDNPRTVPGNDHPGSLMGLQQPEEAHDSRTARPSLRFRRPAQPRNGDGHPSPLPALARGVGR
eukprot:15484877-Alexandrium_andersonii.AAC.1